VGLKTAQPPPSFKGFVATRRGNGISRIESATEELIPSHAEGDAQREKRIPALA
jgi:hypothetical protein